MIISTLRLMITTFVFDVLFNKRDKVTQESNRSKLKGEFLLNQKVLFFIKKYYCLIDSGLGFVFNFIILEFLERTICHSHRSSPLFPVFLILSCPIQSVVLFEAYHQKMGLQ